MLVGFYDMVLAHSWVGENRIRLLRNEAGYRTTFRVGIFSLERERGHERRLMGIYDPCLRACPMERPLRCPIPKKPGIYDLSEGSWPGNRTFVLRSSNAVTSPTVLAGQQICLGDIATMRNGGIARVESAAESGDGMNWGDVSGGAYQALASVDTVPPRGRQETVPVYTYGAWIESILDAGAEPECCMGVDLRAVEGDKRVDRKSPVTSSTDHRLDRELWQRTRVMSEEDMADSIRKKAFLGRLVKILSGNDPYPVRSKQGDYGAIEIQPQSPA